MEIRTTDLFLVAYFLNNNIQPIRIITEQRSSCKKKIIFIFSQSKDVKKHTQAFKLGQAVTNVTAFKNNFHVARDLMFDKLRNSSD